MVLTSGHISGVMGIPLGSLANFAWYLIVLAVLVFTVIVWISEAISYPLGAIVIIAFLILFLRFALASTAGGG